MVSKGSGPSLSGHNWLRVIRLDSSYLKRVYANLSAKCQELIDWYPTIFLEELGLIKGTLAQFEMNANVHPNFCHAHPVPYSLCVKVEA